MRRLRCSEVWRTATPSSGLISGKRTPLLRRPSLADVIGRPSQASAWASPAGSRIDLGEILLGLNSFTPKCSPTKDGRTRQG
jgi:hypothetical protein